MTWSSLGARLDRRPVLEHQAALDDKVAVTAAQVLDGPLDATPGGGCHPTTGRAGGNHRL